MDWFVFARWLHVIGATVLLGTGSGIAFFMLLAHRTHDPRLIAHVVSTVVIADFVFTATAVVLQPITGIWLASLTGRPFSTPWILASIGLYFLTGALWLPVVWMQKTMRDLARTAADKGEPLPPRYFVLFRAWFLCGIPAFGAVLAIIWLMIARPALW
ncbi:MAG: hypothetical protein H6R45_916 [Proteobacteria bacterium]|nr:hypothetical protein [Pseudomonadota bacterium]